MATDRQSEFELDKGEEIKASGTVRRRVASSFNAFAIATFSTCDWNT